MKYALLTAALASLMLTGCEEKTGGATPAKDSDKPPTTAPAAKADSAPAAAEGTKVADLPLTAIVPEGAQANAGAPGFYAEDDSVSVMVKEAADTDPQDLEAAKKAASEFAFKKWNKAEKTADGWAMSWTGIGMDMSGKEYDNTHFSVRRKIGEKSYDCYGGLKKAEHLEKNLKICQSLKAE